MTETWSSCIRQVREEEGLLWCGLAASDDATSLRRADGASEGQSAVLTVPACRGMDASLVAVSSAVCSVVTLLVAVVPVVDSVS